MVSRPRRERIASVETWMEANDLALQSRTWHHLKEDKEGPLRLHPHPNWNNATSIINITNIGGKFDWPSLLWAFFPKVIQSLSFQQTQQLLACCFVQQKHCEVFGRQLVSPTWTTWPPSIIKIQKLPFTWCEDFIKNWPMQDITRISYINFNFKLNWVKSKVRSNLWPFWMALTHLLWGVWIRQVAVFHIYVFVLDSLIGNVQVFSGKKETRVRVLRLSEYLVTGSPVWSLSIGPSSSYQCLVFSPHAQFIAVSHLSSPTPA